MSTPNNDAGITNARVFTDEPLTPYRTIGPMERMQQQIDELSAEVRELRRILTPPISELPSPFLSPVIQYYDRETQLPPLPQSPEFPNPNIPHCTPANPVITCHTTTPSPSTPLQELQHIMSLLNPPQ